MKFAAGFLRISAATSRTAAGPAATTSDCSSCESFVICSAAETATSPRSTAATNPGVPRSITAFADCTARGETSNMPATSLRARRSSATTCEATASAARFWPDDSSSSSSLTPPMVNTKSLASPLRCRTVASARSSASMSPKHFIARSRSCSASTSSSSATPSPASGKFARSWPLASREPLAAASTPAATCRSRASASNSGRIRAASMARCVVVRWRRCRFAAKIHRTHWASLSNSRRTIRASTPASSQARQRLRPSTNTSPQTTHASIWPSCLIDSVSSRSSASPRRGNHSATSCARYGP